MAEKASVDVLVLTAKIVAAHISHNQVTAEALPVLIESVYHSLSTVETPQSEPAATQAPAVPIKKSVFPDFIICLEDGRKLKTLKRHLRTSYNMTPAAYREKWKLPDNYPMVAPAYASHRSTLAKSIGLGRRQEETGDARPPSTRVSARRAKGSKG